MLAFNLSEHCLYLRAVLIVALFTSMPGCTRSRLSREDIKIAASDLRSYAAAAQMLCERHKTGDTTDIFFRSQSDMLREKVNDARTELDGSGGENEIYRSRAYALADRLAELLASDTDQP